MTRPASLGKELDGSHLGREIRSNTWTVDNFSLVQRLGIIATPSRELGKTGKKIAV